MGQHQTKTIVKDLNAVSLKVEFPPELLSVIFSKRGQSYNCFKIYCLKSSVVFLVSLTVTIAVHRRSLAMSPRKTANESTEKSN